MGAPVVTPQGLVGLVSSVSPNTAEVRLITDPGVQIAVSLIISPDGERADQISVQPRGVVSATSGSAVGVLQLRHLQRGVQAPSRTKVVTNGKGGLFPPAFTVGYLTGTLHADESGLEQVAQVAPSVDFTLLEDVFIRREG